VLAGSDPQDNATAQAHQRKKKDHESPGQECAINAWRVVRSQSARHPSAGRGAQVYAAVKVLQAQALCGGRPHL
jgi:hypothetical protein